MRTEYKMNMFTDKALRFGMFLVCYFATFSLFAQQSRSAYVGQSVLFNAPSTPANTALSTSAWGCYGGNVTLEEQKVGTSVYGVKATINSYFTGSAEIRCDYYYYWYDNYGAMHQNKATTYFYLSCNPVNTRLNTTNMQLNVGEGAWLEYSLSPSISPTPTVRMYSSNSNVATVNSNGYVYAVGSGSCVITVENSAGPPVTCQVRVNKVDPTSVSLPAPSPIYIGQTVKLTPQLYPANAQTTYSWRSGNTTVAEVSGGSVTGRAVGTARITVTTANGLAASCDVEVYKPVPSSVSLNKTSLRLPVGGTETLTYKVSPSYAIYSVSWKSDAPDVVSVSNGRLEAKTPGEANITVTTDNGKVSTCKVTVPKEPTEVSINPDELELVAGQSKQLSCSFVPADAATLRLTWESQNPDVAMVSSEGVVTAKAEGMTRLSVRTANGVVGECNLIVHPAPTSINISETSLNIHIDDEVKLNYNVLPTNAVYTTSWNSSNPNVASVNSNGEVLGKAQGTAKITVSTSNGLSASCNVSVYYSPTSISLNKTSLRLIAGEQETLTYTVSPANALYTVSWNSDAPDIVTVNGGRLEARKQGIANISVITDNGKTAICEVTVPDEPTAVLVKPEKLDLLWGRTAQLTYSFVPANAETKSLTWMSSDTTVATVDQQGRVVALSPGNTTLSVTTRNGVVGKCELTVPVPLYKLFVWTKAGVKTGYLSTDKPQFSVEGDIVHFSSQKLTLDIHRDTLDKFTLEPVLPEHPTYIRMADAISLPYGTCEYLNVSLWPNEVKTTLKWFNDNPKVVNVTQDGLVTALAPGCANLMVQTNNGLHANCRVIVPEPYLRFFVWLRNGEVHAYDIDEHPDVALEEEKFILTSSRQTVHYNASEVLRFTLQDEALVDGIMLPKTSENVQTNDDILQFSNCTPNSEVRIYDTAGRLILAVKTDNMGGYSLPLTSLNSGIYIIKTDNTTIKIQKR